MDRIIVLFDLDGTLIDSREDLTIAVNRTMNQFGMEKLSDELILRYVGNGITRLLYDCARDKTYLDEMVDYFISFYTQHLTDHTKAYRGISYVLETIKSKGIKMGVVTNKMTELSKTILNNLRMIDYFDIITGGELYKKKPHPEAVVRTANRIGEADRIIMIGDSENDIIAGKLAEFETAGVLWGLRPGGLIKALEPNFILTDSMEILKIL